MGWKRRQVVIVLSVIYLAMLTALAIYAMHTTITLNLPIASLLSAFAVALPPLAGVALETVMSLNDRLAARGQIQTSRIFQITVAFFLIVEAAVATLAGTHITSLSPALQCGLSEKWQRMYTARDGDRIRYIQDLLDCCGFNDLEDRGFPFDISNNNMTQTVSKTCVQMYGYDRPCRVPWRLEERKVGIMLMMVAVGVFVWKIVIILAPSSQSAWLPSQIRLSIDDSSSDTPVPPRTRNRATISTTNWEGNVAEDESLRRVVDNLNEDSQLATHVESNRRRPSAFDEANQWQQARRLTS